MPTPPGSKGVDTKILIDALESARGSPPPYPQRGHSQKTCCLGSAVHPCGKTRLQAPALQLQNGSRVGRKFSVLHISANGRRRSNAILCLEHNGVVLSSCKTPDFHRKSESLYHRDSPWISGYRVQNVSQIDTQSHTSHHIELIVHEFITSPLWSTSIQASWLNQSKKILRNGSYLLRRVSIFILLATGKLERSDVSLSRISRRCCSRTRTRTLHTQSLSPRSGIGPRHQLYAALSGLPSKGKRKWTRKRLSFPEQQQQQSIIKVSPSITPKPKSLNTARNHLVTQGNPSPPPTPV
jgi:hypothetical protein